MKNVSNAKSQYHTKMAESFDCLHLKKKLLAPKASGGAREQRLRLKKEKEHTRVRTKDCNRSLL